MQTALKPEVFRKLYKDFAAQNPKWNEIPSSTGNVYEWDRQIHLHPGAAVLRRIFRMQPGEIREINGARALAIFGDSVTTDHISPAGSHQEDVAGRKIPDRERRRTGGLQQLRLAPRQRPRDDARHVRQRAHQEPHGARRRRRRDRYFASDGCADAPGEQMSIYDAAMKYQQAGTPLVVIAGQEYGTGSVARLGGEGHESARRESRRGAELRAHPPQQPRRHGRAAAAIQGRHERADA